jgi:uncharacterized membrane protein YeaQ/YmgE (transglycosylase-associated protein family)
MTASVVFAVILSGLWTGALARLAIPGPDPMPIWLTLAIGLAGSIVGAVVGKSISNDNGVVISFLSFGFAMALVAAYRRFVQRRPIFGPGALAFPERGLGVEQTRERLQKLGLDPNALRPNALRPEPAKLEQARLEAMLKELHRAGVLTDEELADKLAGLQHPRVDN